MRYIKKIESIPLVDGGKVINSLSTTDNPDTNATSISIFKNRTDGNLLFNGNFSSSYGWTFAPDNSSSNNKYAIYTIRGARFDPGCSGYLTSSDFLPESTSSDFLFRNPGIANQKFSLSVIFAIVNTTSANEYRDSEKKLGKVENLHVSYVGPQTSDVYLINEENISVSVSMLGSNIRLRVNNGSNKYLYILHMRLEAGAKATPISYASNISQFSSLISNKLSNSANHLLPNGTDLNSFYKISNEGWWMVDTDHYSYSNLPDGYHGNGFLELVSVGKSATVSSSDGNDFLQVLHDQYCRNIFVRRGWGTDTIRWVPWQKYSAGPKIMKWGAPSAVIAAHMSTNIQGPVEMSGYTDGYTAKGVVSVLLQGDVCLTGFDLFNDPNDNNKRKVRIFVFNPSNADVLVQPQVGILYDTV